MLFKRLLSLALVLGLAVYAQERADGANPSPLAAIRAPIVPPGTEAHVLAAGDIARCDAQGDEATVRLLDELPGEILTLGDNVYPAGSPDEFRDCFTPTWGRHLARIHPSVGNHEYRTENAAGYFDYFGDRAGTPGQGWYSFDLGSWHVVMLNSNCALVGGCGPDSAQGRWLEADLTEHASLCTLAAWHHPVHTSGEIEKGEVEVPVEPGDGPESLYDVFHRHGGDVILNGHDHHYERFAPQDVWGQADPSGPRQFIVGTGGANPRSMGPLDPNSEVHAGGMHGVLALTLRDDAYDWRFVPVTDYGFADAGSADCVGLPAVAAAPPSELVWNQRLRRATVSLAAALAAGLVATWALRRRRRRTA